MDGHGLDETARVIQAHVVAMYLPSLASAFLIGRLGARRLMAFGVLAMAATVAVGLSGQDALHYWWALVILGVGWNFLFVGGTTALVAAYRTEERFRAQAANDFSVFGMSAAASLSAGALLHGFGWQRCCWPCCRHWRPCCWPWPGRGRSSAQVALRGEAFLLRSNAP